MQAKGSRVFKGIMRANRRLGQSEDNLDRRYQDSMDRAKREIDLKLYKTARLEEQTSEEVVFICGLLEPELW